MFLNHGGLIENLIYSYITATADRMGWKQESHGPTAISSRKGIQIHAQVVFSKVALIHRYPSPTMQ